MKTLIAILSAPFRCLKFLIELDRNNVALNADDRDYLEWKKDQNQ